MRRECSIANFNHRDTLQQHTQLLQLHTASTGSCPFDGQEHVLYILYSGKFWIGANFKGKLVRRAISASSPCPSRSVGDLCRRGTPSPLTPPKTTLLTRVLARRRRIIRAREHTKIRIRKFTLKTLQPFIRNFAPSKISRYTVTQYVIFTTAYVS